tara:strand:- start:16 stop:219 length:204 start_codon:yes stop_codon:yes gene_type:complete
MMVEWIGGARSQFHQIHLIALSVTVEVTWAQDGLKAYVYSKYMPQREYFPLLGEFWIQRTKVMTFIL